MCDINEEKISTEQSISTKKQNLAGSFCMKCKDRKAILIVRVHDPICRECFLIYTTHKFRSTLGKSRIVKANDLVLLALSTGQSSTAMLHLIKEALNENAHKRLKFTPAVVFIDESSVLPNGSVYSCHLIEEMTKSYGYPFFIVPIYQNYSSITDDETQDSRRDRNQFVEHFNSIKTLSAKSEYLSRIRMSLIARTALEHNYQKVMLGENATTLSIKLLCNVAQGRGATIPQDIAVADNRFSGVTIIRPMREFSSKEVAFYNRLNSIEVNPLVNIDTMQSNRASLQRQTEEFVNGLQSDFSSTVNTIFRTGDKISIHSDLQDIKEKCVLCQGPLIGSSTIQDEQQCGDQYSCCGSSDECTSGKFNLTWSHLESCLCYGCKLTVKDMDNDVTMLPNSLLTNISSQLKRVKMKHSIQEFLLD